MSAPRERAGPRWSGRQRRIGLTGGIATGKSSVAILLARRHGLTVLDADLEARHVLADGSSACRAVLARYGDRVQATREGSSAVGIDRAALGRIVFAEPHERRWLETLVHPQVRARLEAGLRDHSSESSVVLMVPLLFEAGLETLCSEVWLVQCSAAVQLERLITRDGLPAEEARRRVEAQWPLERKRSMADVLLCNEGSPEQLEAAVSRALLRSPMDRR
ncbi:dephospho-CoA kinase [Synechococcus sp. RSCCF101]|uniref:dephospho-CoA kinase n=1 Tax=Synechococcus sp. RSCCF101 TaxID=2511069 RepID=UPI001246E314|nr:dephospho-CoA kinase [Synechococcus sp. RSCCF101]QEY32788.1 dephospho-CoA kinase [Synechococcus sp. RSCCF101]